MADETGTARKELRITDRLWNVEEVAEFLGLSVGTIYHLVSERRIPFVRLSARCLRFQMDVILAWIDQKAEKGDMS
jgi:excisionase family DNA binding protein